MPGKSEILKAKIDKLKKEHPGAKIYTPRLADPTVLKSPVPKELVYATELKWFTRKDFRKLYEGTWAGPRVTEVRRTKPHKTHWIDLPESDDAG
ncbi:MAG: hypothetical protein DRI46_07800 [Chloroflexi bacterium]|nr:MAG: hypothetical protein DRI46_07800 [Chloroflexota bacterium]